MSLAPPSLYRFCPTHVYNCTFKVLFDDTLFVHDRTFNVLIQMIRHTLSGDDHLSDTFKIYDLQNILTNKGAISPSVGF